MEAARHEREQLDAWLDSGLVPEGESDVYAHATTNDDIDRVVNIIRPAIGKRSARMVGTYLPRGPAGVVNAGNGPGRAPGQGRLPHRVAEDQGRLPPPHHRQVPVRLLRQLGERRRLPARGLQAPLCQREGAAGTLVEVVRRCGPLAHAWLGQRQC